ncbi:MAG: hypothetical protein RLZZ502_102, partial [Pseudomonadota bacterium]
MNTAHITCPHCKNNITLSETLATEVDEQVAQKLNVLRTQLVAEEGRKAKLAAAQEVDNKTRELAELQEQFNTQHRKLTEAQNVQAELLKKQRLLDDERRELELTIQKRVQENLGVIQQKARRDAEEVLNLKVLEREQTIASMQQKIEELKQKAEQGSQQLQGEVQELELEALLRVKFPHDL